MPFRRSARISESPSSSLPSQGAQPAGDATAISNYNSGVTLMRQGRIPEAIEAFEGVVQIQPDLAEAHYALGILFLRRGDTARAKEKFYIVERIDPAFIDAYNNLGALLAQERNYREAIDQFLQILRLNPNAVKARVNLSIILDQMGKSDWPKGAKILLRNIQVKGS